MTAPAPTLPADIRVFNRGWLSSANTLCLGPQPALIDTGHAKHAEHTRELVGAALGGQALARIAHTHLHSDHCGGTAALQARWPGARTAVPQPSFEAARAWNEDALTYHATGQRCPRFRVDEALAVGATVRLGARDWQVHAAPGHDALAVFLFNAQDGILIAGDALWERGVGIVFPELDGSDTFAPFLRTLAAIEALDPAWVIPGHGEPFARAGGAIARAIAQARQRIAHFQAHPRSHALYAAKVFVKYELMDIERTTWGDLLAWMGATPDLHRAHQLAAPDQPWDGWARGVVQALVAKGALREDAAGAVHNV